VKPERAHLSGLVSILMGASLAFGCGISKPADPASSWSVLELLRESKLANLLGQGEWEASGVLAREGLLYIVFDNTTSIATVDASLTQASAIPGELKNSQYEAITYDDHGTPHFYVVRESEETGAPAVFRSRIVQFSGALESEGSELTDAIFQDPNTGLEGIAWMWAGEADHLLALCEAKECGIEAQSAGRGRVKVLVQEGDEWRTEDSMEVPEVAAFLDYSDVALRDRGDGTATVAIVSQRSSALWLGTLAQEPWQFLDTGVSYAFPRRLDNATQYCNVEGVSFLDEQTLAVVSDKTAQSGPCSDKDQSVHLFRLPQ
jgi:hypothetical protein